MNKPKSSRADRANRNARMVADYLGGMTQAEIARRNKLHQTHVGAIIREAGLTWRDRGRDAKSEPSRRRESRSIAHIQDEMEAGLASSYYQAMGSIDDRPITVAKKRFEVNAWGVAIFLAFVGLMIVALK